MHLHHPVLRFDEMQMASLVHSLARITCQLTWTSRKHLINNSNGGVMR